MVKTVNRFDLGIASISIVLDRRNFIHNNIHCYIDRKPSGDVFYINGNIVNEKVYDAKYRYCVNEVLDFSKKYDYNK